MSHLKRYLLIISIQINRKKYFRFHDTHADGLQPMFDLKINALLLLVLSLPAFPRHTHEEFESGDQQIFADVLKTFSIFQNRLLLILLYHLLLYSDLRKAFKPNSDYFAYTGSNESEFFKSKNQKCKMHERSFRRIVNQ